MSICRVASVLELDGADLTGIVLDGKAIVEFANVLELAFDPLLDQIDFFVARVLWPAVAGEVVMRFLDDSIDAVGQKVSKLLAHQDSGWG